MTNPHINIELASKNVTYPITSEMANRTIDTLNDVFNSDEFRDVITKNRFIGLNKENLTSTGGYTSGETVYNDLINKRSVAVNLVVTNLMNPWKRFVSKTMSETNIHGNTIVTYDWWLKKKMGKEVFITYASHVGHQILHTKYYKYQQPESIQEIASATEDLGVKYKIDNILEDLIRRKV